VEIEVSFLRNIHENNQYSSVAVSIYLHCDSLGLHAGSIGSIFPYGYANIVKFSFIDMPAFC